MLAIRSSALKTKYYTSSFDQQSYLCSYYRQKIDPRKLRRYSD